MPTLINIRSQCAFEFARTRPIFIRIESSTIAWFFNIELWCRISFTLFLDYGMKELNWSYGMFEHNISHRNPAIHFISSINTNTSNPVAEVYPPWQVIFNSLSTINNLNLQFLSEENRTEQEIEQKKTRNKNSLKFKSLDKTRIDQ